MRRRLDQLRLADHQAAGLRAAQALAAGEHDQAGAQAHRLGEVGAGRKLGRRVDDDRDAARLGHRDHLGELLQRLLAQVVDDRGGVIVERRLDC